MTQHEAQELAARIRKQANTSVETKIGSTNGKAVVHVVTRSPRRSVNVASLGDWLTSDLNSANKAPAPRKSRTARRDEADAATVEAALTTVYSPED